MKYYISRGGQQYGPYSLEDLQRMRAQGQVDPSDLAWGEGMATWTPLSQVLESAAGAQAQQQPPQQQPVAQQQQPQQYTPPAYAPPPSYGGATAAPAYDPMSATAYQMQYATWVSRVVAYLIDYAIVLGVMMVLYLVAGTLFAGLAGLAGDNSGIMAAPCCMFLVLFPLATILVGLYNRVYLVAKRGYSIGQGVMKLKVVNASGNLLSAGTLVLRLLVQAVLAIIPIVGILDLLWPLWDLPRQTLHDKAVGSFVINNPAAV